MSRPWASSKIPNPNTSSPEARSDLNAPPFSFFGRLRHTPSANDGLWIQTKTVCRDWENHAAGWQNFFTIDADGWVTSLFPRMVSLERKKAVKTIGVSRKRKKICPESAILKTVLRDVEHCVQRGTLRATRCTEKTQEWRAFSAICGTLRHDRRCNRKYYRGDRYRRCCDWRLPCPSQVCSRS